MQKIRKLRGVEGFNDDDLNTIEAVKPEFYQLVYTRNTLSGLDDISFRPSGVSYDASLNRVALTFNRNIDAFVDPITSALLPLAAMRLRIGNSESPSTSPVAVITPATDPGSRFDNAIDLVADGSLALAPKRQLSIPKLRIQVPTNWIFQVPMMNKAIATIDISIM